MSKSKGYVRKAQTMVPLSILQRKITEITPMVYASFALALKREYGFGFQRILRVLASTQEIWNESINEDVDVISMCADETGIDVMSSVTAKELGAEGEEL